MISVKKQFAKYVSQNVFGMIGMSLYILADTFFIAKAVGANGITALNLVLPVYNLIFAIGAMIGVGSAIRYTVSKNRTGEDKEGYFFNALFWGIVIGIGFLLIGLFLPEQLVALLGGDEVIVAIGAPYTRIFMLFSPFFILNYICNAFVRNDGAPSIAMAATLCSSLFNIVMDYVLMFPLKMGMPGAALATAISPVIGILICTIHFRSKRCSIAFHAVKPSFFRLIRSCQLGVAAFVGEISSGVITTAFNMIILSLAGNIGVAAYGVVANTSLVAVAIFNGVSQGSQPLVSSSYGKQKPNEVKLLIRLAVVTTLVLASAIFAGVACGAKGITAIFNSEGDATLAAYAETGLRLYFTGFLFAGINIVGTGILSAVESAKWAFTASILRGFVLILLFAFTLSAAFGMNGVWLAFPAAEFGTMLVTITGLVKAVRHPGVPQSGSKEKEA